MKWDIENFEVKKDTEGNLYLVSHSGMIVMKFRDRSLPDSKNTLYEQCYQSLQVLMIK